MKGICKRCGAEFDETEFMQTHQTGYCLKCDLLVWLNTARWDEEVAKFNKSPTGLSRQQRFNGVE